MSEVLGAFIDGRFFPERSGFVVVTVEPAPAPTPEPSQALTVRSAPAAQLSSPSPAKAKPSPVTERSSRLPAIVDDDDAIDEIMALLAQTVKIAQTLSPANQRRARDLVHASISVLNATTVLPKDDQTKFQDALKGQQQR